MTGVGVSLNNFNTAKEIAKKNSINKEQDNAKEQENKNVKSDAIESTKKKKKVVYIDDGHAIADMNVEGFSWYNKQKFKKFNKDRQPLVDLRINHRERIAMILGALSVIMPIVIIMGLLYGGVFLLLYFWVK